MKFRKAFAVVAAILMLGSLIPMVSAADSNYVVDCDLCGDLCEANPPITYGGKSLSEDVNGLAFKFDVAVTGMAVAEDGYTAIYDNGKLGGYKVVKMGAIASNGFDTSDVTAKKLFNVSDNAVSFAVRIINIPQKHLTTLITIKPYVILEINGTQHTIYGAEQAAAYQSTPDNWTPIG